MKFQIGDKVLMLHSGEEGVIVDFIDKSMVLVEVDGTTFPVFSDQIDFPYFRDFTQKKSPPKATTTTRKYIEDIKPERKSSLTGEWEGLQLCLLPVYDKHVFDEDIIRYFKVYLINGLKHHLISNYKLFQSGNVLFELKNDVPSETDIYLHDVSLDDLSQSPRFYFHFELHSSDESLLSSADVQFRVKGKKLFSDLERMRNSQKAHFSYVLLDAWPLKADRPFEHQPHETVSLPALVHHTRHFRQEMPASVIDLHIEKLTQDWRSLLPQEILDFQLDAFEKYYQKVVSARLPMLIAVHGVGKGVLRDEIHQALRSKKEVSSFINQFHPRFGYGSTEIYFTYK